MPSKIALGIFGDLERATAALVALGAQPPIVIELPWSSAGLLEEHMRDLCANESIKVQPGSTVDFGLLTLKISSEVEGKKMPGYT